MIDLHMTEACTLDAMGISNTHPTIPVEDSLGRNSQDCEASNPGLLNKHSKGAALSSEAQVLRFMM